MSICTKGPARLMAGVPRPYRQSDNSVSHAKSNYECQALQIQNSSCFILYLNVSSEYILELLDRACILVQVAIYRKLWIGRNDHLDQSGA